MEVASRAGWRAWLAANHARPEGIWLVTWKKADPGGRHVPYDDVVEEALCFGWVDSQGRGLDAERSMQLLTPRRAGSKWSRSNKERIARLEAAGLMAPAGAAAVARARADGTWTALDDVENLVEPPDLAAALDAAPAARRHWDAFTRSPRRATLEWIAAAKRPATRERRIAEAVVAAAENRRANEWRPPGQAG